MDQLITADQPKASRITEHERRWLALIPQQAISDYTMKSLWDVVGDITQGYLSPTTRVRITHRQYGEEPLCELTTKQGTGVSREESTIVLDEHTARSLLTNAIGSLEKVRYQYVHDPRITLDVFKTKSITPSQRMCVLEFETTKANELTVLPPTLHLVLGTLKVMGSCSEVTGVLTNYNLCQIDGAVRAANRYEDSLALDLPGGSQLMPIVALTGGPCGGKSTIIERLRQNPKVLVVPEIATTLIVGYNLAPGSDAWQRAAYNVQIAIERAAQAEAVARGAEVVVVDRPACDGAAFIGQVTFELLNSVRVKDVCDHYSCIIHVPTLSRELYEANKHSNPGRRETYDEAKAVCDKLRWLYAVNASQYVSTMKADAPIEDKYRLIQSVLNVVTFVTREMKHVQQ